jgi:hypothetical protein
MFHRMYDKLAMGLPTHRPIAFTVLQKALLSKGACRSVPIIGRIQVVIVDDDVLHGYQSFP